MPNERPFCLQHRLKEGQVAFSLLILFQLVILSTTQAEKGQVAFSLLILIQLAILFTTKTEKGQVAFSLLILILLTFCREVSPISSSSTFLGSRMMWVLASFCSVLSFMSNRNLLGVICTANPCIH